MKDSIKTTIAVLMFLIIVGLLVFLSLQRSSQVQNLINQVTALKSKVDKIPAPSETTIKQGFPVQGTPGVPGLPGRNGINGSNGQNGKDGKEGRPGQDGQNAYQLWLSIGNTGTVSDFLNSLQGEDGAPGRQVELRCNPLKLQNEWRYIGDSTWRPLDKVEACI